MALERAKRSSRSYQTGPSPEEIRSVAIDQGRIGAEQGTIGRDQGRVARQETAAVVFSSYGQTALIGSKTRTPA